MLPWVAAYYFLMASLSGGYRGTCCRTLRAAAGAPSVVHATRIGREFIVRAALDFAHKHELPFVLTPVHHPRWRGYLYREYDKIYREADAILALTEAEKEVLVLREGGRGRREYT